MITGSLKSTSPISTNSFSNPILCFTNGAKNRERFSFIFSINHTTVAYRHRKIASSYITELQTILSCLGSSLTSTHPPFFYESNSYRQAHGTGDRQLVTCRNTKKKKRINFLLLTIFPSLRHTFISETLHQSTYTHALQYLYLTKNNVPKFHWSV